MSDVMRLFSQWKIFPIDHFTVVAVLPTPDIGLPS